MPSSAGLATTQRWLQAVIMAPGTDEEALHWPPAAEEIAPSELADVVLPSRKLSPLERVSIYRGMYELRLREALEVDYPLLSDFLGDELWTELAEMYLQAHPSRSYTLNRLGDHLPEFLNEIEGLPRAGFVRDLACYELLRTVVFDAPECVALTPGGMSAVSPEQWENTCLVPIDAFRLQQFRYPMQNFESGQPAPKRKDTNLVLYRRDYRVLCLSVTRPAFRILSAFAEGKPLGEALQGARAPRSALFGWFQQWVSEGIFQRLEITSRTAA